MHDVGYVGRFSEEELPMFCLFAILLSTIWQEYKEPTTQNMPTIGNFRNVMRNSLELLSNMQHHNYDPTASMLYTDFLTKIIVPIGQYTIPVITLDKDTPKEAVCQVFENVNTGGVALTVFELITAVFAMDDFELRKDWEERQQKYFCGDLLSVLSATDFLTACTLLSTYTVPFR